METQVYSDKMSRSIIILNWFIGMIIFLNFLLSQKNGKTFFSVGSDYKTQVDRRSMRHTAKFIKMRESCLGSILLIFRG